MHNSLLFTQGLPKFSHISPAMIVPSIVEILAQNKQAIDALVQKNTHYTWENFVAPLEEFQDRINRAWSPVSHMNSVVNSDALRAAYNECLPKLTAYATAMGHNLVLYQAFKQIANGTQYADLDQAQKQIIDNALRDFRLAGIALDEQEKARFKVLMERLSRLGSQFEENILDATQAWQKHFTEVDRLHGLSESAQALLAQNAKQENLLGWVLKLDFPSYLPVMSYAHDRALRQEIYTAYVTRASDQYATSSRWDNTANMQEIMALRHEAAQLLGFDTYADRSLATKMARSPQQVLQFLKDLAKRSIAVARQEYRTLCDFAKSEDNLATLEAWDIPYYSERLRKHRYAISQEDLKPYFPIGQVLQGMFEITLRLFGYTISAVEGVDRWHEDVLFFQIKDAQQRLQGQFYMDLYARPKKRGGAWMDDCLSRKRLTADLQLPVAYITCNFTPPVGAKPSLLTHDEVQTLFHEFGHGMQHMFTQIDYPSVSGINGVPWDAVELPSQFFENWCWHRDALDLIARHYETEAALPDALYKKMLAAKNFQSGMQMVRQLEFALFDFRVHLEYDLKLGARLEQILKQVRDEVAVYTPPVFNRFAHSFSHIFAGGYAAGYYSYKWAEVLSADAFSKFEERGIFDRDTGREFLHSILENGGARDPMDLFVQFRGREPDIDALLRHNGMAE